MVEPRVPATEPPDVRAADEPAKCALEAERVKPVTTMVDEKGFAMRIREDEVPHREVVPKGVHGGGVQGHQTMFVELGVVDRQDSSHEFQVPVVEADHLPDPKAGAGCQADHRPQGQPTERLLGDVPLGRPQESLQFVVREDVGRPGPPQGAEFYRLKGAGHRVDCSQVFGEGFHRMKERGLVTAKCWPDFAWQRPGPVPA